MSELSIQDLQAILAVLGKEQEAMKKYVEVLERCCDEAEVYHDLQDRGIELKDLKKEAGL